MMHRFKPVFLLAPLAALLIAAAPTGTAPPPAQADRMAQAAAMVDAGKADEALAILDGLLAQADLPADKGQVEGLRSFALARLGKFAEARKAIEFAVDAAMNPTILLLRQLFVLRALTDDVPGAAQTLQLTAVTNPKWLAELPPELVGEVLRGLNGDEDRRFDLAYTLVSAGFAPPDQTVGDGDALKLQVITGLAARGRLEEARPLVDTLLNPVSLVRLGIDRRTQPLWPALEQRLGPGADLADAAYIAAAEKRLAERPQSLTARLGVAEALNIASREPEALERIKDVGDSAEALAKLSSREQWIINLKARLLADAGEVDKALAALDSVAALPAETAPNAMAFRIIAADMAEEAGRHADALKRIAAVPTAQLNDFGKQSVTAIKVCALARSGQAQQAGTLADTLPAGWTKAGNNRAVQAAYSCLKRMDAASAVLIKRLDDSDSRDDALFDLQPFLVNDRPNAPDRLTKADLRALKARPDVKAAFLKYGRDLPAAVAPPR
jgi:tetratricopeptide (TPR) repeat protein